MKDKRAEWEYFTKRRNVDLNRLLIDMSIKNYDQLKEWCKYRRVKPPEISCYQAAVKQIESKAQPISTPKQKDKPISPPKKRSYRKRKPKPKK